MTRRGMTVAQVMALDPTGATYTFVDHDSQEPTHIASGALARFVQHVLPVTHCTISPTLVQALENGDLGVEEPHAWSLPEDALKVPGVIGEWGDAHICIDGAHRLWRCWKRGDATFPSRVVPEALWREFTIIGLPGSGEFWDMFNRTAQIRTPEMEALLGIGAR